MNALLVELKNLEALRDKHCACHFNRVSVSKLLTSINLERTILCKVVLELELLLLLL